MKSFVSSRYAGIALLAAIIGVAVFYGKQPAAMSDPDICAAQKSITLTKLSIAREDVIFYAFYLRYIVIGGAAIMGIVGLSYGLSVSAAKLKAARRVTYEIGGNKVVVHERDLSLAAPIAMGLMNAEQLKQMNGGVDKALQICEAMARLQSRQFHALANAAPANDQPALTAAPIVTPTFADLLHRGDIAAGKPLIFGYEGDAPFCGTWKDLFSCAVGGESGSGKTSTLRSIIAQSVLQGYQFWLIDPHYPHDESLQASLLPLLDAGVTVGLAKEILHDVEHTIDRRLHKQEADDTPRILIIDEIGEVTDKCSQALAIINKIATQGRKVKVYGLFAGHTWLASRTGGDSAVRDCLTARIAHRMEKGQARALLQDNDLAKQVKDFKTGQVVFRAVGKSPRILQVPYCSAHDVKEVATTMIRMQTTPIAATTVTPTIYQETGETLVSVEETVKSEFGNIVREKLTKIGLSQNKFAEICGVSKKDMSLILNDKTINDKPVSDAQKADILRVLQEQEKQRNTLQKRQETATETSAETVMMTAPNLVQ